jgi:dTDP-4-dehydrorhamnose 3,5-epimerase
MRIERMSIEGAWRVMPEHHRDDRGLFLDWFRPDALQQATGSAPAIAQASLSTSRAGTVRGVHFADVPPGQAKYVTCVRGAVSDVVVDLRTGSPTYGSWEMVRLDDEDRHAVHLAEGLGHGFCALTPEATLLYLFSVPWNPRHERVVQAFDPDLGITWPPGTPVMSERDRDAPGLARLAADGLLPSYDACRGGRTGERR